MFDELLGPPLCLGARNKWATMKLDAQAEERCPADYVGERLASGRVFPYPITTLQRRAAPDLRRSLRSRCHRTYRAPGARGLPSKLHPWAQYSKRPGSLSCRAFYTRGRISIRRRSHRGRCRRRSHRHHLRDCHLRSHRHLRDCCREEGGRQQDDHPEGGP